MKQLPPRTRSRKATHAPNVLPRAFTSGVLLLWLTNHAMAACTTSAGVRLQATAGSVCDAAGSYGSSGVPSGQSALGASTGGIINAAGLITMTLSQSGINGVYATGSGSQINLLGGLTLSRPGSSTGIRGLRAASGGTVTVSGPLSITLSNGASNYGIYAELASTRVVLNGDTSITMGAGSSFAPGIRVTSGAGLVSNGTLTISTAGDSRSDAIAADTGGTAQLNGNLNLTVSGQQASTLKITSAGTITYTGRARLTNSGLNGSGIRAVTGGVVTATASSTTAIQSSGINSIGISVRDAGSQVNLAGPVTIQATGATRANTPSGTQESYAAGLLATGGGALNATGSLAITTTDASSYGAALLANSPSISATGGGSITAAGSALGFLSGSGQSASFDGFAITSAAGDLVRVDAATGSTLTLKNSNATASSTGNLLQAVNGSSLTFTADNSVLSGNVVTDAGSTVDMRLLNGSSLTGSIDPVALSVDATSRWAITGSSSLSSLTLAGRIDFQPPGSGFSPQTLTVNGNWVGQGGIVGMRTALGDSASLTDRIVINGGSVSGSTTLQVSNAGGLGALTAGDGILLVNAINGATTTAQTTKNGFSLAGGHVDAGAYEYRLYAADASGAGENWYLRSTTTATTVTGTTGATGNTGSTTVQVPTYRAEVPLYAALPSQLRQGSLAMLGNLHLRVGDDDVRTSVGMPSSLASSRRAWGRVISTDLDIQQGSAVSPTSKGRLTGFQAGTDLLATPDWRAGIYVGQLDGDARVSGFASGIANLGVGRNDLRSQYLGVYGTYTSYNGFYADAVVQSGRHRFTVEPLLSSGVGGKGNSLQGSIEVGQAFALGGSGWTVEPQLQLIHQHMDLGSSAIAGAVVQPQADSAWIARLGVRVKGEIDTGVGKLQPYGRFNVYKSSSGTDVARFVSGATTTDISAPTGGTSSELAGGFTLALSETTSLYGELGKLWSVGGEAKVRSAINGSLGVRVKW